MGEKIIPEKSEYIELKKSKIHLNGVFAKKDIPKGTKIIQYGGEKITKKEAEKRADIQYKVGEKSKNEGHVYIFELNKKYDLDGNVPWNLPRLINHSCNPNCETEQEDNDIWIISTKKIKKGEEITYNYGYNIDSFTDHPCGCGSKNCVGYIVAEKDWPKLKKILK